MTHPTRSTDMPDRKVALLARRHRTDSGPVGAFCGDDVTQDGLIQGMHFDWLQWW